jgi:hypothetical protein
MRMLGFTPHRWQEEFLDVAYEVDDSGRLVYDQIVALLPRRSGKTVLDLTVISHRGHAFRDIAPQRSLSMMQSSIDSRSMFRDTWLPILERSEFAGTYRPHLQLSHEQIRWQTGAIHSVRAPLLTAGVGSDLDLWICDEAWCHESDKIEGAIAPTMATRVDPQRWFTSMAGDDSSALLIAKRDLGRELVELGVNIGTCYIEFSAPEDADPLDEAVWWMTHPALGNTMTIERLRSFAQQMDTALFAKEFLGIWPTGRAAEVIDSTRWAACADSGSTIAGDVWLAYRVDKDRANASIAAAGFTAAGRPHVEIVRSARGADWVVPMLTDIWAKQHPRLVAVDGKSAGASFIPKLEKAGVKVESLNLSDAVRGAGHFYDAVIEGRLAHLDQPSLNTSVAGAVKRTIQNTFAWGDAPGIDSTPLKAATDALWVAQLPDDTEPEYQWRPWDITGGN